MSGGGPISVQESFSGKMRFWSMAGWLMRECDFWWREKYGQWDSEKVHVSISEVSELSRLTGAKGSCGQRKTVTQVLGTQQEIERVPQNAPGASLLGRHSPARPGSPALTCAPAHGEGLPFQATVPCSRSPPPAPGRCTARGGTGTGAPTAPLRGITARRPHE